jgi:hypothetical protein
MLVFYAGGGTYVRWLGYEDTDYQPKWVYLCPLVISSRFFYGGFYSKMGMGFFLIIMVLNAYEYNRRQCF